MCANNHNLNKHIRNIQILRVIKLLHAYKFMKQFILIFITLYQCLPENVITYMYGRIQL